MTIYYVKNNSNDLLIKSEDIYEYSEKLTKLLDEYNLEDLKFIKTLD